MAFIMVIFFLASAGASSAYLTVSEIFPMETRALSIAFFYAVGTAAGGIAGPLLFGHLIATGSEDQVAIGFFIGAVVMAIGGIAELLFGVRAEQKQLEDVAEPLTAEGEGEEANRRPEPAPRAAEVRPPARRSPGPLAPGPGPLYSARAMGVTGPHPPVPLDTEVADHRPRAARDSGSANRRELAGGSAAATGAPAASTRPSARPSRRAGKTASPRPVRACREPSHRGERRQRRADLGPVLACRYGCHDGGAVALHGFGLTLSGQRRWKSIAARSTDAVNSERPVKTQTSRVRAPARAWPASARSGRGSSKTATRRSARSWCGATCRSRRTSRCATAAPASPSTTSSRSRASAWSTRSTASTPTAARPSPPSPRRRSSAS